MRLKETADDFAVKDNLWLATRREIFRFADRFDEERVPGEPASEGQDEVLRAAKRKGYRRTIIRSVAENRRKAASAKTEQKAMEFLAAIETDLLDYRRKVTRI